MSFSIDVCSKCGSSMEKLSDGLEIWRCPRCELRHVFMNYRELVPEGQGLIVRGRTFDDIDGVPANESCIAVTPGKDLFEQRLKTEEGGVVIERWFELQQPYRREAGKQREECSAIIQLLAEFNKAHQSNLINVIPDPHDRKADVMATDPAGIYKARFQVVVADHKIWRTLAASGELHERISEGELFDRLKHVLTKKVLRAASDVILVLDGLGQRCEDLSNVSGDKMRNCWLTSVFRRFGIVNVGLVIWS